MKRVLVIDDDVLVRESLCRGLGLLGYETIAFESAEEALAHISDKGADMVVCDLFMPGMDGLEFLALLGKMVHRPRTVMISGGSSEQEVPLVRYLEKARKLGADAVLSKPFSLRELEYVFSTLDIEAAMGAGLRGIDRQKGERR